PLARYVQYRLTLGTFEPSASPVVTETLLTAMDTRAGPTAAQARATIIPQEATSGVPQPRIISRKGWGANEALATRDPLYQKPTHFVIHHTVTPNHPQDPAYMVRAVFQYHAVSKGWGDVGYNFLIDEQGNIYEGRKGGDGTVGIHAGDYNYGSIGIALLGDYRTVEMTPAMKEALVALMSWEADRFGINPIQSSYFVHRDFPNIVGHRDLWTTVCPGDKVYQALPEVRKLVWQRLLASNPRVQILSPDAGQAVSGEVQVRVTSPSPTTSDISLLVDGSPVAEGKSSVSWVWNTGQYAEGRHRLQAVASSTEGRSARAAREVVVDNTPPTGSMVINEGATYTSQLTVTLSLEAEDVGGQIAGMQFTQDKASQFTELEEFAASREWLLPSREGAKTVGVRFVDWAGNTSPAYSASITLDTDPPRDWRRLESVQLPRVMVGVTDYGSGLDPDSARYSLSADGGYTWGPWQPTACQGEEVQQSGGSCYLEAVVEESAVRFGVADRVGNEAYSPAYGELVATPTPEDLPQGTPAPPPSPEATPTGAVPSPDLPDLVVDSLVVSPPQGVSTGPVSVTVTIRNDGAAEAATGFWIELFVDPADVPAVNSVVVPQGEGALWYVPGLAAGAAQTLSLGDVDERYSNFTGSFCSGRHELYAIVDAYNTEGKAGLVAEADEDNNVLGPLVVDIGVPGSGAAEPVSPDPGELVLRLLQRVRTVMALLRDRL
ncbi:MAG: N-acetylmuramoyl-L-alanine amidase, partial [Anaerolineae bacterium]|nr:N-acetylmuramoyl-L-alanine amidase [Anaerolineae bacterium]